MEMKVESLNHLAQLARDGKKVTCPQVNYMDPPKLASWVMSYYSGTGLERLIDKGLFCEGKGSTKSSRNILEDVKAKVRALGLSQKEMAERLGVPQSRVSEFLLRPDAKCSTMQKYITEFNL